MVRPQQIAPPEGWRTELTLAEGFFAAAPHLACWQEGLSEEWQEGRWLAQALPGGGPLCVEFCSGNGTWIASKAAAFPEIRWIAVERRFDRARQIRSKAINAGLHNLLVFWGNAEHLTECLLPDGVVEGVYINFPDPWPRRRHAQRRILRPPFVDALTRVMRPGAPLWFVTDDPLFAASSRSLVDAQPAWVNVAGPQGWLASCPSYGVSTFEQLWKEKGKQIHYHCWRKLPVAPEEPLVVPAVEVCSYAG